MKLSEWKNIEKENPSKCADCVDIENMGLYDWKINSKGQYAVIVIQVERGTGNAWAKAGIVAGAILLAAPTGGLSLGLAVGAGAVAGGIVLFKNNPVGDFSPISPTLYPWDVKFLKSLNVDEFVFSS